MKKKLILFDVDGTLVNSFPSYAKIMQIILPKFGREANEAQLYKAFTMTDEQEVKYFKIPEFRVDDWNTEHNAAAKRTALQPEDYPKVDEMFQHLLKQPEIKLGIVTSRTKEDAQENLQSFWWFQEMALVVTSSDTKKPKPAGEPIEFALNKLGYRRDEAFYIGDADTDEQAALNAGVSFGGALWGTGTKDHFKSDPLLLDSPADIIRAL